MLRGTSNGISDCELVAAARAGDRTAFEALVTRYRRAAYGTALHYLYDPGHAEDAAQEAFIQAYLHLHDLRDSTKFGAWLRKAVANQCAAILRRRASGELSFEGSAEVEKRAAGRTPADYIVAQADLAGALSSLSDKLRLTFLLETVGGYPHAEIARYLDIPVATVRSRLRLAKQQLREEMTMMTTERLQMEKADDDWTRQVVAKAIRRGNDALRQHDRASAVRSYDEALDALSGQEIEVRRLRVEALLLKFHATKLQGSGAPLLDEAMRLADEIGDPKLQAEVCFDYATTVRDGGSAAHYRRAAELFHIAGDRGKEGQSLLYSAIDAMATDDTAEAKRCAEEAKSLLDAAGDGPNHAVSIALLRLLDDLGNRRPTTLMHWQAVSNILEVCGDAVRFTGQPGFSTTRLPGTELQILFLTNVFLQAGQFGTLIDPADEPGRRKTGSTHSFDDHPLSVVRRVVSNSETVTTPAGEFHGCLQVRLHTQFRRPIEGEDPMRSLMNQQFRCGSRTVWYAPGVGLVKLVVESAAGQTAVV